MDILDRVPAMTGKRVNIGSGTLYTLLEQFLEDDIICETRVEGRRRGVSVEVRLGRTAPARLFPLLRQHDCGDSF